jgi:hypothetical protein
LLDWQVCTHAQFFSVEMESHEIFLPG